MYEIGRFINSKKSYATGLIQYQSGRFGIVGSVPVELCVPDTKSLTPGAMKAKVFETKEEGHKALTDLGYVTTDGLNYHKLQEVA